MVTWTNQNFAMQGDGSLSYWRRYISGFWQLLLRPPLRAFLFFHPAWTSEDLNCREPTQLAKWHFWSIPHVVITSCHSFCWSSLPAIHSAISSTRAKQNTCRLERIWFWILLSIRRKRMQLNMLCGCFVDIVFPMSDWLCCCSCRIGVTQHWFEHHISSVVSGTLKRQWTLQFQERIKDLAVRIFEMVVTSTGDARPSPNHFFWCLNFNTACSVLIRMLLFRIPWLGQFSTGLPCCKILWCDIPYHGELDSSK